MAPLETKPTAEEVVTYGSPSTSPPDLRLLHYNDVYHLDASSAEPVGGIARFMTVCNEYQQGDRFRDQPACLTLFSGDAFNPSLESSITKGSHMVPILNAIGTDCASLGNHDLDFGVGQFRNLAAKCSFPWLIANVLDADLGPNVPIGNAKRTHIITASNGLKIGIIGLGEREWLETINSLPPNLIYKSATETAKELIPQLRADGADLIVALTHMREPNDNKLAENVGDQIDIILGGHDHYYSHSFINGCHVLRSGTDFKQLSYIEARKAPPGSPRPWEFVIYRRDIVSSVAEHRPTLELANKLTAKLKQSLEKPVGWTAAPLDARFTTVRLRESNIGNFVCDIMRHHCKFRPTRHPLGVPPPTGAGRGPHIDSVAGARLIRAMDRLCGLCADGRWHDSRRPGLPSRSDPRQGHHGLLPVRGPRCGSQGHRTGHTRGTRELCESVPGAGGALPTGLKHPLHIRPKEASG